MRKRYAFNILLANLYDYSISVLPLNRHFYGYDLSHLKVNTFQIAGVFFSVVLPVIFKNWTSFSLVVDGNDPIHSFSAISSQILPVGWTLRILFHFNNHIHQNKNLEFSVVLINLIKIIFFLFQIIKILPMFWILSLFCAIDSETVCQLAGIGCAKLTWADALPPLNWRHNRFITVI